MKNSILDPNFTLPAGHVLGLRTNAPDNTSRDGSFQWPEEGHISAPDWQNTPRCGKGLHFLLWGGEDASLLHAPGDPRTKWLVIMVEASKMISLNGKHKTPSCEVVYVGDRDTATQILHKHAPKGVAVHYANASAGDYGTAVAGYQGTASAGYQGTASAGNHGTASAGYYGTARAGDYGTAVAGDHGTAVAGYQGTASAGYQGTARAGDYGTAVAGDHGTAVAGYQGTASAGYQGTAVAGNHGTASAGYYGTASAGYCGVLQITYYSRRKRVLVGYVGEDVEPNTPYKVVDGKFVKAS